MTDPNGPEFSQVRKPGARRAGILHRWGELPRLLLPIR
jgi:hypothetical protein